MPVHVGAIVIERAGDRVVVDRRDLRQPRCPGTVGMHVVETSAIAVVDTVSIDGGASTYGPVGASASVAVVSRLPVFEKCRIAAGRHADRRGAEIEHRRRTKQLQGRALADAGQRDRARAVDVVGERDEQRRVARRDLARIEREVDRHLLSSGQVARQARARSVERERPIEAGAGIDVDGADVGDLQRAGAEVREIERRVDDRRHDLDRRRDRDRRAVRRRAPDRSLRCPCTTARSSGSGVGRHRSRPRAARRGVPRCAARTARSRSSKRRARAA